MSEHTHHIDVKTAFTVEKLPGSQVKITGEIPYEDMLAERPAALRTLSESVTIDGFRKGHIPEAILVKHVGEMAILSEMAERVVSHMYHHILHDHQIDAVGQPKLEITKIAPLNPLGITITVAVLPEITLGDYGIIAKGINAEKTDVAVSDEELDNQIKDILRRKAAWDRLQAKAAAKANTEPGDLPTPETVDQPEDEAELPLPELTDDVAKALGQPGQFTDVADFKTKLREHLTIEKIREATATHRAKLTDSIIESSQMELPQVLIDAELTQMFGQMQEDLERANLKFDEYLTHIKKTKEELEKEWTPAAEKRAKLQLLLNEIAKKENITPNLEEVEEQVNALTERYKDADKNRVRLYVASVLTNEAVMKHLEQLT